MATSYVTFAQVNPKSPLSSTPLISNRIFSPGQSVVVSSLTVTNVTSNPVVYSIFVTSNVPSITYTEANALVFKQTIEPNSVVSLTLGITLGHLMNSDNIAVQSETGSALTFMAFGSIIS